MYCIQYNVHKDVDEMSLFHNLVRMVVVVPPERHPVISGIKQSAYYPGKELIYNCIRYPNYIRVHSLLYKIRYYEEVSLNFSPSIKNQYFRWPSERKLYQQSQFPGPHTHLDTQW